MAAFNFASTRVLVVGAKGQAGSLMRTVLTAALVLAAGKQQISNSGHDVLSGYCAVVCAAMVLIDEMAPVAIWV